MYIKNLITLQEEYYYNPYLINDDTKAQRNYILNITQLISCRNKIQTQVS